MKTKNIALIALCLFSLAQSGISASRIKDIAYVQGGHGLQVLGYGLVVGLNGTGDTQRSSFTMQSVGSMLKRFGINVPQADLRLRNVAAVMVTTTVPSYAKFGGMVDVVVSSMGDATSLQGGTLLLTPLTGLDGDVYAMAQGPLSVGGISVQAGGSEVRRNHTAAGRIPNGAQIEKPLNIDIVKDWKLTIVLLQPDFTTAMRIASIINGKYTPGTAIAIDPSTIEVTVPDNFRVQGKLVEFVSVVELLEVNADAIAKVVINERTGTVVVGEKVTILPVAISHGGVNIEIQETPVISQPNAFSQGKTVVAPLTSISAKSDSTNVIAFPGATTVQEVARALNMLKVAPRDIIAIFQALKEAGALKAELVII
jgi:flagellar P-ring protein precursor FlgI